MALASAMARLTLAVLPSFLLPHPRPVQCRLTLKPRRPAPQALSVGASGSPPLEPQQQQEEPNEEDFTLLAAFSSRYNDIMVVDTPSARFLLLDSSHNVHSMMNKGSIWTGSYWDDFVCLPAIVPQGPIAILGLGAGTAAHLLLEFWPSMKIVGWEIDEILINMAREYFGLSDLEKGTKSGGSLTVYIGDALSPSATIEEGFAGIIVDLFSDGKVIPQLHDASIWSEIARKLMPNGRIMVNCGGAHAEESRSYNGLPASSSDLHWVKNATVDALCRAFPGELNWKRMPRGKSGNYLVLTGPPPNLDEWSLLVPGELSSHVKQWKPCK